MNIGKNKKGAIFSELLSKITLFQKNELGLHKIKPGK